MKLNITIPITNLDGTTLLDPESKQAITLKTVLINSLLGTYPDETELTGVDKLTRYELSKTIYEANSTCDITTDNIVLIKKLIGKAYATLVVGQVFNILEGGK